MKKTMVLLGVVCSLLINFQGIAQDGKPGKNEAKKEQKEADKSAKQAAKAETKAAKDAISTADAKAAKVQAKAEKKADNAGLNDDKPGKATVDKAPKEEKATPADYKAPVDKNTKGPDGATVYVGPRGGKYYINKKGNKTYLNSPKK